MDLLHATDAEIAAFYERDRGTAHHAGGRDRRPLFREYAVLAAVEQARARTVLDVGCGDGHLAQAMVRAGLSVVVMDATHGAVDEAIRRTNAPGLVRLVEDLDVVEAFDAVTCCETIEHLRDPRGAVARLARAARDLVVLTTPVGHCYDDPGHLHHWPDARALCEALDVERVFVERLVAEIPSQWGDTGRVFILMGVPKR